MAGEDTDPKTSASATVLYVFMFSLFNMLPQFLALAFLVLASVLHMFSSSSYVHMPFAFSPIDYMTCFISTIIVIFYLLFLLIKSFGKLLIFPTIQKPYYRQFTSNGFAASMRPPMFEGIHYKRWRVRAVLWFQTMSCYDATLGKPDGELDAQ